MISLIFLLFSNPAIASESVQVGCAKLYAVCDSSSGECQWLAQMGRIAVVDLTKAGNGPGYEIWKGNRRDLVLDEQPFNLDIFQRREGQNRVDYLSIELAFNGSIATSMGREVSQVQILNKAKGAGVGIRCTTAIVNPEQ